MNCFKQKAIVLLLVFIFTLTGCSFSKNQGNAKPPKPLKSQENEDIDKTKPKDEKPEKQDEEADDKEALSVQDDEAFSEIKESDKIDGWKRLILKDQSYTTTDWESFSYEENSPMVAYSLDFPGDWELEYTVFYNENGEKIAELFPAIVMKPEQKLMDNWKNNAESEIISKQEIKVGSLNGIKIMSKAYPSGGDISEWYPHTYYITDGKQVFAITFYDLKQDSGNQELYDKIINTFEFK